MRGGVSSQNWLHKCSTPLEERSSGVKTLVFPAALGTTEVVPFRGVIYATSSASLTVSNAVFPRLRPFLSDSGLGDRNDFDGLAAVREGYENFSAARFDDAGTGIFFAARLLGSLLGETEAGATLFNVFLVWPKSLRCREKARRREACAKRCWEKPCWSC